MKKILTCVITAILLMTSLLLGGCDRLIEGSEMKYGDFYYCYVVMAGDNRMRVKGDYVAITRLTAEGKQKDTIIIPDEIDGKPVIQIGMVGFAYRSDIWSSDCEYTKLYLPKTLLWITDHYGQGVGQIKIFVQDLVDLSFFDEEIGRFYVSENLYDKFDKNYNINNAKSILHIANLEFVSEGNTYFIGDYNVGDILNLPIEPIKKGYTFVGWYKEPECINIWDFENDAFALAEGETIMKLYAKWEEIK